MPTKVWWSITAIDESHYQTFQRMVIEEQRAVRGCLQWLITPLYISLTVQLKARDTCRLPRENQVFVSHNQVRKNASGPGIVSKVINVVVTADFLYLCYTMEQVGCDASSVNFGASDGWQLSRGNLLFFIGFLFYYCVLEVVLVFMDENKLKF